MHICLYDKENPIDTQLKSPREPTNLFHIQEDTSALQLCSLSHYLQKITLNLQPSNMRQINKESEQFTRIVLSIVLIIVGIYIQTNGYQSQMECILKAWMMVMC